MRYRNALACALLFSFSFAFEASAVGTLIPAPGRVDMVHDAKRGIIYVSTPDRVLRYHVASASFLSPVVLGGQLSGIDLSPDGNTLVVADRSTTPTQSWLYLVSLDTLVVQKPMFTKVLTNGYPTLEAGTFTAVYGADGNVYASSAFAGSGTTPLRRLTPANGTWTILATVTQEVMLAASGDAQTIAFAEHNRSDGPWGLYDIPTGSIVRREWYTNGTSEFNYEIATDRFGSQFAIPTFGGTKVYDDVYQKIATLGVDAGSRPIGVAYHPVERIAYFPWSRTAEVRVYDMNTRTQTGSYNFEFNFDGFDHFATDAFVNGRTKLSRDGSVLMSSVGTGVRFVQMYAPLAAAPVGASTYKETPIAITLAGSIGNGGLLSYSVPQAPTIGTVNIVGSTATYQPPKGFTGVASFGYRVTYGRATRDATVVVKVDEIPQSPPIAEDDSATIRSAWGSIQIPVLGNDSDPDGDALQIIGVTQPSNGRILIRRNVIQFTTGMQWSGISEFSYTISDGEGGFAKAEVTVTRN